MIPVESWLVMVLRFIFAVLKITDLKIKNQQHFPRRLMRSRPVDVTTNGHFPRSDGIYAEADPMACRCFGPILGSIGFERPYKKTRNRHCAVAPAID
jgi:hypothetical protein